jgi:hypothetical protein
MIIESIKSFFSIFLPLFIKFSQKLVLTTALSAKNYKKNILNHIHIFFLVVF